ncbi:MAG: peptidoglycan editing factor PgeF [Alphaproteobacteria bacterium]
MQSEIILADNLGALSGIRHAFFTRSWGNAGFSGQENATDAAVTREQMAAYLHVNPQNLLSAYQIHSPDVVTVTEPWAAENRPKADALVTDKPGIALGVLTADCVPLLFADAGVIGAAHAGWRGAVGGVIDNTLDAMEKLGARRERIHAALGPCIWQKSYEVGSEFPAPFLAENPDYERFFRPAFKSDHYQFDLPGYVVAKLHDLGVHSVAQSPADTCAEHERFYSHRYSTLRAEKRGGNLMSAIALI